MGKKDVAMIQEIGRNVERFAGEAVRKRLMEGSEQIATASSREVAEWVKRAIDRLDKLVEEKTRVEVMENCGYSCAVVNKRVIERAKARRKKFKSIDEFLEAEQSKPMRGTRLVREGDVLYQSYTPSLYRKSLRCYCSLVNSLPRNETISLTYCHCSKGFVKKFWEAVLERPVKVGLIQSTISGAEECKFAVYL